MIAGVSCLNISDFAEITLLVTGMMTAMTIMTRTTKKNDDGDGDGDDDNDDDSDNDGGDVEDENNDA